MGSASLVLGLAIATASTVGVSVAHADEPLVDRLIVEWARGVTSGQRQALRARVGADDPQSLGRRFETVSFDSPQETSDALRDLRADPSVLAVARDVMLSPQAAPDDPDFARQWALSNTGQRVLSLPGTAGADIDALNAWQKTTGSPSIIVAIIDTGHRFTHPDLSANYWTNPEDPLNGKDDDANGLVDDWRGWDFSGRNIDLNPLVQDNDPTDDVLEQVGHGSHVAGIAAAQGNDGKGIAGVAQQATVMPLRACGWSAKSYGEFCPLSATIAAINYAGTHGARVANLSLAGGTYEQIQRDAFAANPGTLFVASAGNSFANVDVNPTYPCADDPSQSQVPGAIDNVVCVASTDNTDHIAGTSNYGKTRVDLAAPGDRIFSALAGRDIIGTTFNGLNPLLGWSNQGWVLTSGGPLASQGITNNSATQALSTARTITTPAVSVTPRKECQARWWHRVKTANNGEYFTVELKVDGVTLDDVTYSGARDLTGELMLAVPIVGQAARNVSLAFTFGRGNTSVAGSGAWVDDVHVFCTAPAGQENSSSYGYLSGTSMAAPQVSGAAALLLAYEPKATVTQLRTALLNSVDPVADLNPNTGAHPVASGGRLNADAGLVRIDALVSPDKPTISAGPDKNAKTDSATFAFSTKNTNAPVTYECGLDAAPLRSGCTSPMTLSDVPLGTHTLHLKAVDTSPAHNRSLEATWTWSSPGPPPDTQVVSGPGPLTAATSVAITFGSSTPGVSFECALGREPYSACSSPYSAASLGVGLHSFMVRAVDGLDRRDSTPARVDWEVLPQQPPDTQVSGAPSGAEATFTFSSAEGLVTFECAVDGQPFSACHSPVVIGGMTPGDHTFAVRAVDRLHRPDPTPASVSWTVAAPTAAAGGTGPLAVVPNAVTGMTVSRKRTTAVVRWAPSAGASSYLVRQAGAKPRSVETTSIRLRGLKPRKAYRVSVVAVAEQGTSQAAEVKVRRFARKR